MSENTNLQSAVNQMAGQCVALGKFLRDHSIDKGLETALKRGAREWFALRMEREARGPLEQDLVKARCALVGLVLSIDAHCDSPEHEMVSLCAIREAAAEIRAAHWKWFEGVEDIPFGLEEEPLPPTPSREEGEDTPEARTDGRVAAEPDPCREALAEIFAFTGKYEDAEGNLSDRALLGLARRVEEIRRRLEREGPGAPVPGGVTLAVTQRVVLRAEVGGFAKAVDAALRDGLVDPEQARADDSRTLSQRLNNAALFAGRKLRDADPAAARAHLEEAGALAALLWARTWEREG